MNKILYTLFAGATLLTAGCSSDDVPQTTDNGCEVAFVCSYAATTRATDTSFEDHDQIGVFMTADDALLQIAGNEINNELFSYNGSSWTSARKVYWDEGLHNVYAYYPYSSKIDDVEDYTFEVQADQSTHEGLTASDFLWASLEGVEGSASPIALQFSHRMSKVVVQLEKGEDYEGEIPSDCEVYILNTATTASVDFSTGGVAKADYSTNESIHAMKIDDTSFQAIVVPQNIETRRPLVEVVTSGISYLMDAKLSFKQGYCHTLIVTLSKNPSQTAIEIGGTIGGWE